MRGPGAADVRQRDPDQRPGPDRAGQGAVHAVLRRRDRRRGRRPDRLPARRRRGLPRPERRQHRRGGPPAGGSGAGRRRGRGPARALRRARRAGAAERRGARRDSGCRPSHDYMSFVDARLAGHAGRRVPHRLHRRARLRAGAALGRRRRAVGRRARGRRGRSASGRAGWAPATRCAPRWATRCTGRTSRWTSRRCRRACGWAVGWKKPAFWGRDALLAEKEAGAAPAAVGARGPGARHPARRTWRCRRATGEPVGEVTSGTFSPTRQDRDRAGAAGPPAVAEGDEVVVDVRGRPARFRVVKPPFVTPSTRAT